jgi:hypothetical protein
MNTHITFTLVFYRAGRAGLVIEIVLQVAFQAECGRRNFDGSAEAMSDLRLFEI